MRRGGADRLELCADLIIGGTTPSPALLRQVKAETGLPVRALIRPRFGDFCYDSYELAQMAETAAALVQAGAFGIAGSVVALAALGIKVLVRRVMRAKIAHQVSARCGGWGGSTPAPRKSAAL